MKLGNRIICQHYCRCYCLKPRWCQKEEGIIGTSQSKLNIPAEKKKGTSDSKGEAQDRQKCVALLNSLQFKKEN